MNVVLRVQPPPDAAKIAHSVIAYDRTTEELDLELSPVLARRDRDRETRGDREGGDRPPRREFDDVPA